MPNEDELHALKTKSLCIHCVGEAYLRAEIQHNGRRLRCSYCNKTAKSYPIGQLSERIETVFQAHFDRTSDQPNSWQQTMLSDRESNYDWERDGEPVVQAIANAADMPEEAAQDIQTILADQYSDFDAAAMGEETEFSDGSYYEERSTDDRAWRDEWENFERALKTEARFFSRTAAAHLASIFRGIETMSARDGRPLVIDAGPGTAITAFYRARTFQSDERLEVALCRPNEHLGSPPSGFAGAGRMNARGISVFYGANEARVAIAEVRPPVGSQVAVARFEIIRPLRLLDLTALGDVAEGGSVFDPGLASRLERAMFLRSLSQRITRPVMPDDEAFEYLPTQAIADFLATESESPLDGIVFPSVQAAGDVLNVVLFHKAARVEGIEIPAGTEIEARTGQMYEEGWEIEYVVTEQVPPARSPAEPADSDEGRPNFGSMTGTWTPVDPDHREPALRIDLESIRVHQVRRVQFETEEYVVRRHRWERRGPEF
jgi:RES domain-containing protein